MDADWLMSEAGMDTLVAFVAEELAPGEAALVERLAAQHAALHARLDRVRAVLGTLRSARADAQSWHVPEALRERLKALHPPQAPGWLAQAADHVRELLAGLVLDTRASGPVLAGFRGGDQRRHLIYSAEQTEVELHLLATSDPQRVIVMGQVHDPEIPQQVWVRQLVGGQQVGLAVGADGVFETELPAGLYEAGVQFAERRVTIPAIELSST